MDRSKIREETEEHGDKILYDKSDMPKNVKKIKLAISNNNMRRCDL